MEVLLSRAQIGADGRPRLIGPLVLEGNIRLLHPWPVDIRGIVGNVMRLISKVGSPACPVSELALDGEVPFLRHGILEIPLEVIQSGIRRNVGSRAHTRKGICESDIRHVRRRGPAGNLGRKGLTDPQGPRWIKYLASGAHQTRLEVIVNAVA